MEFAYDVEGFRLLQGDALKLMRELPPESFDMIFADPPYFLSNGGFTVHAGKRASVHKGIRAKISKSHPTHPRPSSRQRL